MKFTRLIAMACVAMTLLCACGKQEVKDVDVVEAKDKIIQNADLQTKRELTSDEIDIVCDLDGKCESITFNISEDPVNADAIAVVKAKTDKDVSSVKDEFKNYIASRKADFGGYAPKESEKLSQSIIKSKGKYVLLVVNNNSKKAEKEFNKIYN